MTTSEFTDEQIKKILSSYEAKRNKEKERYMEIHNTEEFKIKNRERAKRYYDSHKEDKKQKYQDNKLFVNAKSAFYYYKRTNRLDTFETKCHDKCEVLRANNFVGLDLLPTSI